MPVPNSFANGSPHPSEFLSGTEWQAYARELTERGVRHGFEGDLDDYPEPLDVIGSRLVARAIDHDLHEFYFLPGEPQPERRMQTVMRLMGTLIMRYGAGMGYASNFVNMGAAVQKCTRPKN